MMRRKVWALAVLIGLAWGVPAQAVPPPIRQVTADFNGDGVSDLAMWSPDTGAWRFATLCDIDPSTSCGFSHGHLTGTSPQAVAVPGDFDGDQTTDAAVFDPISAVWSVAPINSASFEITLGRPGDTPAPADYNGDGITDAATFSRSDGTWMLPGGAITPFGEAGDVPVPADYDGDGRAELAVYRPADGTWTVLHADGRMGQITLGAKNDQPVPADYNGDGRSDFAVFDTDSGRWRIQHSGSLEPTQTIIWGQGGDLPVPADYDGDGSTDLAVYRASAGQSAADQPGQWLIRDHPAALLFGLSTERPAIAR